VGAVAVLPVAGDSPFDSQLVRVGLEDADAVVTSAADTDWSCAPQWAIVLDGCDGDTWRPSCPTGAVLRVGWRRDPHRGQQLSCELASLVLRCGGWQAHPTTVRVEPPMVPAHFMMGTRHPHAARQGARVPRAAHGPFIEEPSGLARALRERLPACTGSDDGEQFDDRPP
jgi:hypothetical protein